MHIIMFFLWVLFIAGIVLLVRWVWDTAGGKKHDVVGHAQEYNAMDILKLRYAKGEISREEFQAMKQDLE